MAKKARDFQMSHGRRRLKIQLNPKSLGGTYPQGAMDVLKKR
jgi:hypothetical protein